MKTTGELPAQESEMEYFKRAEKDFREAVELYCKIDSSDAVALRSLRKSAFAFWKLILQVYIPGEGSLQTQLRSRLL
jgi:hypothetical protein